MKPQQVRVLLNASSGVADKDQLLRTLEAALQSHAIRARLEVLHGGEMRDAAECALKDAAEDKCDAIIVGGGDGSVSTVAGVLTDTGIPLGIIPLGTLNHFAKDLNIPLTIEQAVAVIAAGITRSVDVGDVNGQIFINNSSVGFYPYLVLNRERQRRRHRLPRWFAMLAACLRVARHFPLRRLTISAEGWTEPYRSPCVLVGNNEYRLTGPSLGTREKLDGGQLFLCVVKQEGWAALLWLAIRSIFGAAFQERDLRVAKTSAVEISSHRRQLLVSYDGEIATIRSPLRYKIRPGALRVFAPTVEGA